MRHQNIVIYRRIIKNGCMTKQESIPVVSRNVFASVYQEFCPRGGGGGTCVAKGHAWQRGHMCGEVGCIWQKGVVCVAWGMNGRGVHVGVGHLWQGGMCGRGACVARGICVVGGIWWEGACVAGGHAWYACLPTRYYEIRSVNVPAVCILLECILVRKRTQRHTRYSGRELTDGTQEITWQGRIQDSP